VTGVGTRLRQDGKWRHGDPFSRFMEPLITPQANKKGRADFARLEAVVEGAAR
jgi:hypothetical protein